LTTGARLEGAGLSVATIGAIGLAVGETVIGVGAPPAIEISAQFQNCSGKRWNKNGVVRKRKRRLELSQPTHSPGTPFPSEGIGPQRP
jgi:hypothetical protein